MVDSKPKKYWISDIREELPIQVTQSGKGSTPPITVMERFKENSQKYPERLALSVKRDGQWQKKNLEAIL